MNDLMVRHWSYPIPFDDAEDFLNGITLPLYYVTNSDNLFIETAYRQLPFTPAGIITSEKSHYTKPNPKIFEFALETAGLSACEVIHIGDSLDGDVLAPVKIGIKTIYLNRGMREVPDGVISCSNLRDCLDLINSMI